MNADGTDIAQVTDSPSLESGSVWSWNGQYIAFVSKTPEGYKLCITTLDGEEQCLTSAQDITPSGNYLASPTWSPDDNRIVASVFTTESASGSDLFVVGTECIGVSGDCQPSVIRLTDNTVHDNEPDWSPDGERIVFSQGTRIPVGKNNVCIIDADGTNLTCLSGDDTSDSSPSWSPDGNKIVFVSTGWTGEAFFGSDHLFVMNADGSDTTLITEPGWVWVYSEHNVFGWGQLPHAYLGPDWAGGVADSNSGP